MTSPFQHRGRRSRRWLGIALGFIAGLAASAIVAAILWPASPTARSSAQANHPAACWTQHGDPGHALGVANGGGLDSWSEPRLYAWMAGLHHTGVSWVRDDVDAGLQSSPGNVDWHSVDYVQSQINAAGICHQLLILDGDVGTVDSFAAFAGAVAKHFPHVNYFQIGNEINFGGDYFYVHHQADPARYLKYLIAANKAIKAVNPNAFIVTGAMAPAVSQGGDLSPADYITKLYSAGGQPWFNAAAANPYSYPVLPSFQADWNSWQQLYKVRAVMVKFGDGKKKIWDTEFGSPTHGTSPHAAPVGNPDAQMGQDHVTPQQQKAILSEAISTWAKLPWTGPFFLYSWADKSTSPDDHEGSFGVVDFGFNAKPAYAVFAAAAHLYH